MLETPSFEFFFVSFGLLLFAYSLERGELHCVRTGLPDRTKRREIMLRHYGLIERASPGIVVVDCAWRGVAESRKT